MKRLCTSLPLALGVICGVPSAADAAIIVNLTQSGTNVVATLTGSLNLAGLTVLPSPFGLSKAIQPSRGYIGLGTSTLTTGFTGLSGPGVFGPGTTFTLSSADAGDGFGLDAFIGAQTLFLPLGYLSGTSLNGSSTFANTTFATLGLTTGRYVFRSPSDTVTINIGDVGSPVPEPAGWAMMIAGCGAIGVGLRRRKVAVRFA